MDAPIRQPYPSDLTDAQWAILEPLLLAFEDRIRPGPPRTVALREVINTLLYQNRTGCQWAYLPHDLLPKSTVYDYFTKYRDHGLWRRSPKHAPSAGRGGHARADSQRRLCG